MDTLRGTHDQLLQAIAEASSLLGKKELTTFFPMKGHRATGELMVVGRAVNGWASGWTPDQVADSKRRTEIIDEVFARSTTQEKCPLSWVCDAWGRNEKGKYNTKRSEFWNVIRSVVTKLQIFDDSECCWASHLIWSDLYKVAPSQGGNSSATLKRVQEPLCHKHLREEIALWNPRRVLFLTGHNWCRSFLSAIGQADESRSAPSSFAQWCGTLTLDGGSGQTTAVVVAVHPQVHKRQQVVSEIMEFFSLVSETTK